MLRKSLLAIKDQRFLEENSQVLHSNFVSSLIFPVLAHGGFQLSLHPLLTRRNLFPQNPPSGLKIQTGFLSVNMKQSSSICDGAHCILHVILLLLLLLQERKADRGELDAPTVSLSSLPLLIPRFPLLLRHLAAKVKSGLVSLLDTQTERSCFNTLRGWRTSTHTHAEVFISCSEF